MSAEFLEIDKSTPSRFFWTVKAMSSHVVGSEADGVLLEPYKVQMIPTNSISKNLVEFDTFRCPPTTNNKLYDCLFPFDRLLKIANTVFPQTSGASFAFLGVLTVENMLPLVHIVANNKDNNLNGLVIQVGKHTVEEDVLFYSHRLCDSGAGINLTYRDKPDALKDVERPLTEDDFPDWSKAISIIMKGMKGVESCVSVP
jgi:hypothetical protein